MSAAPLLGALESAALGSLTSLTGLLQPTDSNSQGTTGPIAPDGTTHADAGHQNDSRGQYSSGIALDLGDLVSLNLGSGNSSSQTSSEGGAAQSDTTGLPDNLSAQSSQQGGNSSLLQITIGGNADEQSSSNPQTQHGDTSTGGITIGPPTGWMISGSQPAGMLAELMGAERMEMGTMDAGDSAAMAPADVAVSSGGYISVNSSRPMPTLDNSRPALAFSQIAQTLGQSTKDARQSDDPHLADPSAAVTANRDTEEDGSVHQASVPVAVVAVAQVPIASAATPASPTVTDEPHAQLSLVSRAAAVVMPAALRVASAAMMGRGDTSDSAAPADSNVPASADPAALDDAAASHTLPQTAASLVPASLLSIVPGDFHAVDQAFEQLLDEIDEIGGNLVGYAASSSTVQWASAGVGLAACLGGAYFQRNRQRSKNGTPDEEPATWMFTRMQGLAAGGD